MITTHLNYETPFHNKYKNIYYGIRHGESEANTKGIIASSIKTQKNIGLTLKGQNQVRASIRKNKAHFNQDTIIISSDFLRAYETALIVASELKIPSENIQKSVALRERFFGDYDGKTNELYHIIWGKDPDNPAKSIKNAESVLQVLERIKELISELEKKYSDKTIILVSHCDPIMIWQAYVQGIKVGSFRDSVYFKTAMIKRIN